MPKLNMNKDARISVRVSKVDKREFYRICELHGLCPSKIMERWIHRFNLNAKKTNPKFSTIVKSTHDEMYAEYEEYEKSGINDD